MERYKFYRDLTIPQITFADALSPADFTRWVNDGGCNPGLLTRPSFDLWIQNGGDARALNQLIENAHARSRTGQTYAQFDGFNAVVPSLKTMKVMAPNETVTDLWKSTFQQFNAKYPQYVDCPQNTQLVNKFIRANRDALPEGKTIAPSVEAWESFFKIFFSRLYLRKVTKVVTEAGAARDMAGAAQSLKVTPGLNEAYNPLLYADIQRKQATNAKARAAKESRERSPYAKPKLESTIVEEILTPQQVMNLSSEETAVLMQPMQFPSTTDSADDWTKSPQFIAETPARQTRAQREQTAAQIAREVEVFCNAFPDYATYAQPGAYDGLSKVVLEKIDSWGLLITANSLKDGFDWAASEGLIPKAVDRADGQVSVFHVSPDTNPHHTRTNVGQIRYHGKLLKDMTSEELQTALNSSKEFRALVDSAV